MAINVAAVVGAFAVIIYKNVIYQRPLPNEEQEFAKLLESTQQGPSVGPLVKLDPLVINLPTRTSRLRFLNVQLHIQPFKKDQVAIIEKFIPIITDSTIAIASSMTHIELNSVSGKILLENRIKEDINLHLQAKVIKRIYFSTFVIQ